MIELPMASSSQPSSAASSANDKPSSQQKTNKENDAPFETAYEAARDDAQSENAKTRDGMTSEQETSASPEELKREAIADEETIAKEELSAAAEVPTAKAGAAPEFGLGESVRKTANSALGNSLEPEPELSAKSTPPSVSGKIAKPAEKAQLEPSQAIAARTRKTESVVPTNAATSAENAVMSKVTASVEDGASPQSKPAQTPVVTKSEKAADPLVTPGPDGSEMTEAGKKDVKTPALVAKDPHQQGVRPREEARDPGFRGTTAVQKLDVQKAPGPLAAPVAPMNAAAPLAKLQWVEDKTAPILMNADKQDSILQFETRSTTPTAASNVSQILSRSETPTMIARQMAEVLQRASDRPVEVSLNPRELGRVRMNISAVEAGITVNVVAERPETLDLMRRNIDQLVREFEALGYNNINFAFAEGEARQNFSDGGSEPDSQASTRLHLDTVPSENVPQVTRLQSTGVDIRL